MGTSFLNDDDRWPPIEEALIKKLDEIYPEKCPDLAAEDRDIWHYGGARSVVRMLISVYADQNNQGT